VQPVSKPPLSTAADAQPLDDAHGGNGSGNAKGTLASGNAVQMPIAELVKNDPPLLQLPDLIAAADSPAEDDSQDSLLTLATIVSEISADTHQPITKAELRALRHYVAGRVSARSTGARRTRGPENIRQLTRAEVESQLAAIRQRGA
jgi:hypothetical protein